MDAGGVTGGVVAERDYGGGHEHDGHHGHDGNAVTWPSAGLEVVAVDVRTAGADEAKNDSRDGDDGPRID